MPTPEQRTLSDGTTTWRVRISLPSGRHPETFYDFEAADQFCGLVDAIGPVEAYRILDDRRRQRLAGIRDTPPTLNEWFERYVASLTGASAGTKEGYRSLYTNSFKPILGEVTIDGITKQMIATGINELQTRGGRKGTGYADKSIANQHGLLSAMFAEAVADELISRNPCDRILLPRNTGHEDVDAMFLTHDEFGAIRGHTLEHHRKVENFLVGTGARWGECEALNVGDIDLSKQKARVTKSAKWVGKSPHRSRIIGPVKTPKSKRDLYLPEQVCEELEPVVHGRDKRERLFLAPRGGPLVHKTFWEHVWRPACERAGLSDPYPRIHDLRHTYASWLIAEGVPMKTLQELLGHESIKTTMDLYAHLMPGALEEAAVAASAAMGKVKLLKAVA